MFRLTQPSSDGEIESATNSEASSHLNISTISQNKALHIVSPIHNYFIRDKIQHCLENFLESDCM